jgi:hypothetical protein
MGRGTANGLFMEFQNFLLTDRILSRIVRPQSCPWQCDPEPCAQQFTTRVRPYPRSAQIPIDGPDPLAFDPAANEFVRDWSGDGAPGAAEIEREVALWHLHILEEMAEMTMVLIRGAFAQALQEQADRERAAAEPKVADPPAPEPAVPEPIAAEPARPKPARREPAEPRPPRERGPSATRDPRVIFAMLSRELRQILGLEARIAARMKEESAAEPRVPAKSSAEIERRNLVLRVLDEAMMFFGDALADHPDFDPDGFRAHCEERMEQEDIVDDLPWVPVSSLVQRISGEVDLPPDWRLWEDEDWAKEEIRTKPPGSPYCFFPFTLEQEEAFDRVYVEQTGLPGGREPPNPRGYFARRRPP